MRKRLYLCISLLGLLAAPAMAKPVNDSIIAVVNNDVITLKDLKDYINGIYRQLRVEHHSAEEIKEIMATYEEKGVQQLVEDKLILAAAKDKGLDIRDEVVEKRLRDIKEKYASEDEFLQALGGQGITITDLKNKIMNQMKARYIVDIEVKNKLFVNPQDVTRYYNEHMNDFTRKTRYSLQSIYVSFDHGKQEARNKAAEARSKLMGGEDFDAVSKAYSELPSVGVIEQGQMVPAIENVVFGLQVDQVSDLVEVDGGVYVFKVTGILPGRIKTLQEARDEIYNKIYDDQFQQKFKEWLDKLRKKNYVEIRD